MQTVHLVEPTDSDRPEAEAFIREAYAREYGARVDSFAPQLLCRTNARGEMVCVAGVRLAADGFFSECYLDQPVEAALCAATGRRVRRDDIYEVTTLASRSPRDLAAFIDDIIAFGARNSLSWCFFTLTHRLSLLVARRHLAPIYLADADPARIANAQTWGGYYETQPKVYGVCGIRMLQTLAPAVTAERHADLP